MGITNNGSYIVVISGEDSTARSGSGRAIVPQPGDGGAGSSFVYSYEGVNYTMRFVTVLAAESNLLPSSDLNLLEETGETSATLVQCALDAIGYAVGALSGVGSVLISMLSEVIDIGSSINTTNGDRLLFTGESNWTVVYTQVFNYDTSIWSTCASVEYVNVNYELDYRFFNSSINAWDNNWVKGISDPIYSDHYSDTSWRKEYAVLAYTNTIVNYCHQDTIDYVTYVVNGEEVVRHWRGIEKFSTIPGLNS